MHTFSTRSLAAAAVTLAFAAAAAAAQASKPASPATQSKPAATAGSTRPTAASMRSTAAANRPASSKFHSAIGTIEKSDANSLTLKTSSGEEQFTLSSSTRLREGAKTIDADALSGLTGQRAKIRYSEANGQKTAQSVMVSGKGGHAKSRG